MTDAAAERLGGLLVQAVSAVQESLSSRDADPKVAMFLGALCAPERSRELGRAGESPLRRVDVHEAEGDAALERHCAAKVEELTLAVVRFYGFSPVW